MHYNRTAHKLKIFSFTLFTCLLVKEFFERRSIVFTDDNSDKTNFIIYQFTIIIAMIIRGQLFSFISAVILHLCTDFNWEDIVFISAFLGCPLLWAFHRIL